MTDKHHPVHFYYLMIILFSWPQRTPQDAVYIQCPLTQPDDFGGILKWKTRKNTTPPAKAIAGLEAHGADVGARQDPTETSEQRD